VKRELTDELSVTDKLTDVAPSTSDETEEAALHTDPGLKKDNMLCCFLAFFWLKAVGNCFFILNRTPIFKKNLTECFVFQ
jgi:hypothetical protein